jgi:hypothetical protein
MPGEKVKELDPKHWEIVQKALDLLTEHFENSAVFVNYVENGQTIRGEIIQGNQFSLKYQVEKWIHGEFDEYDEEDDDDDDGEPTKSPIPA